MNPIVISGGRCPHVRSTIVGPRLLPRHHLDTLPRAFLHADLAPDTRLLKDPTDVAHELRMRIPENENAINGTEVDANLAARARVFVDERNGRGLLLDRPLSWQRACHTLNHGVTQIYFMLKTMRRNILIGSASMVNRRNAMTVYRTTPNRLMNSGFFLFKRPYEKSPRE